MTRSAGRRGMTFAEVITLARGFPGVAEATSYGTPALKVKGKLIARLWEDGVTLVLRCPPTVRSHLLQTAPQAFYLTDHYRDYPYVLVRLAAVRSTELSPLVEEAWRGAVTKREKDAFDASRGSTDA